MSCCCCYMWYWGGAIAVLVILANWLYSRSRSSGRSDLPARTMVILGSGGHTKEILSLADTLSPLLYSPRLYVHSTSDDLSRNKALELEDKRSSSVSSDFSDYSTESIFRSREVGQSWVSSVFTTLVSTAHSFRLILNFRPQLILCNGPGVCVPLCFIAFLLTRLGVLETRIVYVESICRVKSLSLSGSILRHFVDMFFVQWQFLEEKYKGSIFIGRLS